MTTIASFTYDEDGRRVKGTVNGVTTTYIGDLAEWTGSASTLVRYYYADGVRVAMKKGSMVYYLIGDHLGSTSVVATSSGGLQGKQLYKPWGEPRYASASLPTAYTYTGQYSYTDDIATQGVNEGFGLMFYNARWYDPYLNRWTQPDSIIPDPYNVLDWDRFAYARNKPLKFVDPSGHSVTCALEAGNGCDGTGLGDLTPSQIVQTGATAEQQVKAIYNYSVTHPDYNYSQDPELEDTGKFIVANAIFLGNADDGSRLPNLWDRINNSWSTVSSGLSLSIAGIIANGGRLGGPQHQAIVDDIVRNVPSNWGPGFTTRTEIYFSTSGGGKSARFADVGVFDQQGNLVAVYQVGVSTQGGLPISRERQAIYDMFEYGQYKGKPFDGPIIFVPYK